ncbi:hypothetical protein MNEG_0660 [Monoraphidium neglectum]|uniref:Uncharacterized protein n=1 Tax=Monoraphidium neglectum TaxID=145388 RepID=A0A0D2LLN8_9CHLO|nr:hypothetical protein MNEG_0660 [Monoraphidium neglectum]KIZ07284.1 hypothetical protein MNEG_0660 [Monoraphidium neglectum]|eukprot:XP_013906303.1 hypothetical protein MNEG_0660 [Monoraphidium neglectum]
MTGTLSQMVAQVANAVPLPLGIEVFASVFHAATGEAPLALGDPQHGWQDDPERRARGADENAAGAVADAPAASRGSPMDATAPAVVFYEGESDGTPRAIREGILTPAVESWIEFGLSSVTEVEKKAGGLGLKSVTSVMEEVEEKLLEMGESPDLSGVRTRIEAMLDSRRGLKRSIKRTAENA